MTSIIKLEALSGVLDDGPLCYLLQVVLIAFLVLLLLIFSSLRNKILHLVTTT